MQDDPYVFRQSAPSIAEYVRLRSTSGLSPRTPEQAAGAVANSWAFCHVRHAPTDTAVAMGRIIGDGGWYFHIADMATLPDHQRRGLGRRILTWLLDEIATRAPANPYVTLMADAPGRPLYRSMGFVPTEPHSIGMRLG
ncbi:GCN5-related protein N-acetyltransferase [Beutenbergia cavernae DSM 12333]|uniref:GCN5-related protein N-acetyltransferase n=1 Tax=Beutenbergia cavernae (strain ATCC BAA-8 / DSM 12333 / CCUG 43141 / JCM 11478 / NBRC 16432 / NCIMB 13614 / HKI 0122) TaxID=471853 RepID=C5C6H8_BEUC1|nr:GNAT family N-acetyltransferase [Beutenbergia cavernae]ACQ80384.1 GCN5-related protein N-acetyltransferase [Beutenbergia cavernae DSM 12333]